MILKTLLDVIDILESRDPVERIRRRLEGRVKFDEVVVEGVPVIKALYEGGGRRVEILGRLGAIQTGEKGLVSDADGAVVSLTTLLELLNLREKGIELKLDVSFATNLSTTARLIPHSPFKFMVPPVGLDEALKVEVDPQATTVLSIDSTKGNRLAKYDDFALTHVIKDGYILKLSDEVLDIYNRVTEHEVYMVPLTSGDLTPLDVNVYHISTLISPWLYTSAPVVGLATVSPRAIPGYETGVMNLNMLEHASRFCLEFLKYMEKGGSVYNEEELRELERRFGPSNLVRRAV